MITKMTKKLTPSQFMLRLHLTLSRNTEGLKKHKNKLKAAIELEVDPICSRVSQKAKDL